MIGKHLKNSFDDLKETLKRLFRAPSTQSLDLNYNPVTFQSLPPLEGRIQDLAWALEGQLETCELRFTVRLAQSPPFEGRLHEERGWDAWHVQSGCLSVPLFTPLNRVPFSMPRIAQKVPVRKATPEGWQIRISRAMPGRFNARCLSLSVVGGKAPKIMQGLELMFQRPFQMVAIPFQRLPKPLQMRYSLQLVKSTKHNIRSMDILGYFNLPKNGVNAMRFDSTKSRLFLALTPVAARATRVPFLLARLKDSGEILSCYPEEAS